VDVEDTGKMNVKRSPEIDTLDQEVVEEVQVQVAREIEKNIRRENIHQVRVVIEIENANIKIKIEEEKEV
jgi:hypothetical protein